MGYRRRIRMYQRGMTPQEMEQQNLVVYLLLFIAGFFTFGIAWIVLFFLFIANIGNK